MCFSPQMPGIGGGSPSLIPFKNEAEHLKGVVKNPKSLLTGDGDKFHPVSILTDGPPKPVNKGNPLDDLY